MKLYGLKNCDTCKKALKALSAAGREMTFIDVRADGVAADDLASWIRGHGMDAMVNTRSTTWRGLDEATRARAGSPDGALALLQEHPALMKRPVIVDGDSSHVGWTKDVQDRLLG
ncbi:MAG: Spx/MgsR family RNA polymerase-binding regulatory protein [Pseudomonadota bacterium]